MGDEEKEGVIDFALVLRMFLIRMAARFEYPEAEDLAHELLCKILSGKRTIIAHGSKAQNYFLVVVRNAIRSKYKTRPKYFQKALSELPDHKYIEKLSYSPDVVSFIYTQKQIDYLISNYPNEVDQILEYAEGYRAGTRRPSTDCGSLRVQIWRLRRKLRQSLGTASLA